MKILFLIISSYDKLRIKQIELSKLYYSTFINNIDEIKFYYLINDKNIQNDIMDEVNSTIFFSDNENYKPGIFNKTIKALNLFRNSNYDFIIRTNLSTVYIFENLIKFLKSIENITNENEIYGCKRNLFKSEINILESEFQFIIGYNIIIPNKIINKIIQFYELNTQLIDNKKYTVSDDSLLGYIFHNLKITIIDIKKLNYNFDFSLSFDDNNKNINSNTIVIRNRFYNNLDIRYAREIIIWEYYIKLYGTKI